MATLEAPDLEVRQRPFLGIRLKLVVLALFGVPGAHAQQAEKKPTRPCRSVLHAAIRPVTESAISQTETAATPKSREGERVGLLVLRHLRERMPRFAWFVIG